MLPGPVVGELVACLQDLIGSWGESWVHAIGSCRCCQCSSGVSDSWIRHLHRHVYRFLYSVSMAGVRTRTGKLGIRIHLEVCSYRFDSGRLSAREFIIGAIQCFKAEESSTCGGFKGIHTDYRIGYAASISTRSSIRTHLRARKAVISNMLGSRG